jgi:hypothetical protein
MPTRDTLVVGTRDEMRVFDPKDGRLTHLHHIPMTTWLQSHEPNMLVPDDFNQPRPLPAHVAIDGRIGGELPRSTSDHWGYHAQPEIGRHLVHITLEGVDDPANMPPGGLGSVTHTVVGAGEDRMAGFSTRDGLAFVLMTTAGLYTAYRDPLVDPAARRRRSAPD